MTAKFAKRLKLKIHKLQQLLNIEGTGGGCVPYQGYVEVLLEALEVPHFKEYILMLVVKDSEYGNRVPLQLGTLHIDMIFGRHRSWNTCLTSPKHLCSFSLCIIYFSNR